MNQGPSMRRRASLKTQKADASQKTTTTRTPASRAAVHPVTANTRWVSKGRTRVSEDQLADDIPHGKRDADDQQQDSQAEREHHQALAHADHADSCCARSARRYS